MTAYYNEIDPKAAAWLRELIKGRLRGYGNAINAEVASEFIRAYQDVSDSSNVEPA